MISAAMASENSPLLASVTSHDVENSYGSIIPNGNGSVEESILKESEKERAKEIAFPNVEIESSSGSETVIRGGISQSAVESLDYEIVESEVYKEDWRSRTRSEQYQYIVLKWVFVLIIGITTGLTSFGINMAVENLAGIKFQTVVYFTSQGWHVLGCVIYACCNMGLVLAASILCVFVGPAAAGSGIPEVKAYLNGVDVPGILSPTTLFVKIFGSIGSVGGGLVVGKEGPLVHTGACIASILGQGGSKRLNLDCKWLRFFKNDRDRRDLVTCGAAAGVAAAFRAPVGGVLFALEEVTSWWRSPLLWRAFFTNAVVAVVLRTVMQWCSNGNCGLFSSGGFIIFDEFNLTTNYGLLELAPVLVLGILGGVLGSLFNQLNLVICTWRRDSLSRMSPWVKVLDAASIALLTSVVQFSLPWLVSCTPCPTNTRFQCPSRGRIGNYKAFNCPAGQYNDLASLLFNSNDDVIRNLFSAGTESEFSYLSLTITLFSVYTLSLVTYGIAVPSGLFVPAILCGATYGRLVGRFMVTVVSSERVNEGTYALLGSASFLGGSMRMTVSLCVILLELTGNLAMLPLIMLVLLVAKTMGDAFNHAIYDTHLRFKRVPLLEAHPPQFMKRLFAMDAVKGEPVTFHVVERVGRIFEVLSTTSHHAFPVIYGPGSEKEGLYGVILRSHLLVLLKHKGAFQVSQIPVKSKNGQIKNNGYLSVYDFGKPGSGKGLKIKDIDLIDDEMDMYLDLHPFANKSPYTVSEDITLFQAYSLFRQLGLRHLFVVPSPQKVLGVITRKDLLAESFEDLIDKDGDVKNLVGSTSVSML